MPSVPPLPGHTTARSVGAVVTAYSPGDVVVNAVASLVDQVAAVVVVDDGTPEGSREQAEAAYARCTELGAVVVRHSQNNGIGAALDTGVKELRDRARPDEPMEYVLTIDQDSVLPSGFVEGLVAAAKEATARGVRVGMVGPAQATGVRDAAGRAADGVVISREPIQSGLLVPVPVLDELGDFDESLFIDGVDTEFWLRAQRAGFVAVAAPGVSLEHRLGSPKVVKVLGRPFAITVAADFRYFYMHRNLVELLRRYGSTDRSWAAVALAKAIRHLGVTTVLVPGRRRRLVMAIRGLAAGIRGQLGRAPF